MSVSKHILLAALLSSAAFQVVAQEPQANRDMTQSIGVPLFQQRPGMMPTTSSGTPAQSGDDLGNHTATKTLQMNGNNVETSGGGISTAGGNIETSGGTINLDGARMVRIGDPVDPEDAINLQYLNDSLGVNVKTYPVSPENPIWSSTKNKADIGLAYPSVSDVSQLAIGMNARASDIDTGGQYGSAVALGSNSRAHGADTVALGAFSQAGTFDSNNDPIAKSEAGVAIGYKARSIGIEGVAIARNSIAFGEHAVAIGAGADAGAFGSVAIGKDSSAQVADTVSFGSDSLKRRLMNIAPGIDPSDAVTMAQMDGAFGAAPKYTAGAGIQIDAAYAISVDGSVLRTTGNQSVSGVMSFSSAPKSLVDPVSGDDLVRLSHLNTVITNASYTAGDGISLTGNAVSVDGTVVRTSGNQTIDGVKTFSNSVSISSDVASHLIFRNLANISQGSLTYNPTDTSVSMRNYDAAGTFTGGLNVRGTDGAIFPEGNGFFHANNKKIVQVANPTVGPDAANKAYVDTVSTYTGSGGITVSSGKVISPDYRIVQTTGNQSIDGIKQFHMTIDASAATSIRLRNGMAGRGVLFGNNGSTTSLSITADGDAKGGSDGRQPFSITNSTGEVYTKTRFTAESTSAYQSLRVKRSNSNVNALMSFLGDDASNVVLGMGDSNKFAIGNGDGSTSVDLRWSQTKSVFEVDSQTGNVRWKGVGTGEMNASNRRLQMVADPTDPQDAVNLRTMQAEISAAIVSTYSDERLKKNIEAISPEEGMEIINMVNPMSYDFKKDGRHSFGVIAQDFQEIMPWAVFERKDGMLSVDYTQMIAPLAASAQHLNAKVSDLETRLADETQRNEELEARLEALEAALIAD